MDVNMTLVEFWLRVDREFLNHQHVWRYGQAAYNVLSWTRPDLADEIVGTALDPFHSDDDIRWVNFVEYLKDNW